MTATVTREETSPGWRLAGWLLRATGRLLRFIFWTAPLVGLSFVALLYIGAVISADVWSILYSFGLVAALAYAWVKAWRWQWDRLLAWDIGKQVRKLYAIVGIDVRTTQTVEAPGRYVVSISTPDGLADADITNELPRLSAYLRAVNVEHLPDDNPRDGRVKLSIIMTDVLANVVQDDTFAVESIREPLRIGKTSSGDHLELPLWQNHVLIGGQSGRGKSVLANRIIDGLQAVRGRGVELWGIDPHRTEFLPGEFDRLARSRDDASELLADLLAEVERRLDVMETAGVRTWDLADGPAIVLMVDELAAILTSGDSSDKTRKRDLSRLYAEARKTGVTVVGMTQTPSAQLLGELRNNAGVRIAFGSASDDQLGQILGADYVGERLGITVRKIPAPTPTRDTRGMCFVLGGAYSTPTLGRVFRPTES